MNTDQALIIGKQILKQHNIFDWNIEIDRAKKRLGCCHWKTKKITLSKEFTELNNEAIILNTIKHEVAHIIAGYTAGHGQYWKVICKIVGCNDSRFVDSSIINRPKGKRIYICPICKETYTYNRILKRNYSCITCSTKNNNGKYTEKYKLILK
ncbi:hypothetical protein LCGC14_1315620 [marine sediment metagenome]|uniref:SprT-like domain-containing protein n=1 Tax=marine sediment metagenome TaxID=412755 RepID=A0A0F9N1X7_9ZZZZ